MCRQLTHSVQAARGGIRTESWSTSFLRLQPCAELTQHSALGCRQLGRLLVMLQAGILITGAGAHAGARHALKQSLNLARTVREGMGPEVVARVFDQLYEGHQEAPGVGAVDNQPLQQHTCDLLLHNLLQEVGAAGLYNLYQD